MRSAFVVSAVVLLGCATDGAARGTPGARCESFAAFDAQTREQLDALLREAPGERLVQESSRLNAERRACARHVAAGLLQRREARGVEAVQREVDALAATYAEAELDGLLSEALGGDARALAPLVTEARVKAQREAAATPLEARDDAERRKLAVTPPEDLGPAPAMPETLCDEPTGCGQLRCVLEHPPASPDAAAKRCLDEVARLDVQRRAERLAEVLSLLPTAPGPARTEARVQLETLQRQRWPEVERALAAKQPGRAAWLAAPFRALPSVRAQADALFSAGTAHHLDAAKQLAANADAAWVHEALAARLEGRTVPLPGRKGEWAPRRWLCGEDQPELPGVPAGLRAVLTVRCAAPKREEKRDDPMRTFELEAAMKVDATLALECAGRTTSATFRVQEPGVESFPAEALRRELERRLAADLETCAQTHRLAATASCADLRGLAPAQVLARFVGHARFTRRWEPCFVEWLEATEGVPPPPLEESPRPGASPSE